MDDAAAAAVAATTTTTTTTTGTSTTAATKTTTIYYDDNKTHKTSTDRERAFDKAVFLSSEYPRRILVSVHLYRTALKLRLLSVL